MKWPTWVSLGLAGALLGCFDFTHDYAVCLASGKCAEVAVASCGTGAAAPTACANDRDLYLSPTGHDDAAGTKEAPRKTLTGLVVGAGDRIHFLAGTYDGGFSLSGDGVSDCPITVEGDPTMSSIFQTEYTASLTVRGSHWRVSNLVIEGRVYGGGSSGIEVNNGNDVTLQHLDLRLVDNLQALVLVESCTACSLRESQLRVSDGGFASSSVQVWSSPNFVFEGNSVQGNSFSSSLLFHDSPNARVAFNDFDLAAGAAVTFENGGQFERNVVRNAKGLTAVTGADSVVSNTFTNFTHAVAASSGDFRDNIVEGAETAEADSVGLASADGGGAYNFFYRVRPYASRPAGPDDVVGKTRLSYDEDFVPAAGSPVIDAADPTLPVPLGGGLRADIGARERGAVRLGRGPYCWPDAG